MKPKFPTLLTEKLIPASDYPWLAQQQFGNIKSVEIVPPQFGKPGFGAFRVRFKIPILESGW